MMMTGSFKQIHLKNEANWLGVLAYIKLTWLNQMKLNWSSIQIDEATIQRGASEQL